MDLFLQILGLAYFVFALKNLRLAVLMLPLFFPAYLLKFDLGGVPFPLVEVFIYGTFLAWVILTGYSVFQKKLSWREVFEPFKRIWWLPVLGIVAAAVISVFVAPQSVLMMNGTTVFYGRKVALGILKSWIVAPVLMLGLFAWVIKTGEEMSIAVNSYVFSSLILAVWGVFQVLTGQYATPDGRASGPFNSANYLALYITPALFYATARLKEFFWASQHSWKEKILAFFRRRTEQAERRQFFLVLGWLACFLFLLCALLFTKSYAAFLAYFVACLWWFVLQIKDWKRFPWKNILIGAGVVVVLVLLLIALDPAKWQMFFNLTARTSSGVRVEIYTIALRLAAEHPLFGIGLGMFPAVYQLEGPRILGQPLYELNMLHPHDIFLAFWLNLGLLGLASFLWILWACVKNALQYLKTFTRLIFRSMEWFHAIGFLMLVIIIVHGFVDTPFFKNDLALLFWLVAAMILLPSRRQKKD